MGGKSRKTGGLSKQLIQRIKSGNGNCGSNKHKISDDTKTLGLDKKNEEVSGTAKKK